MSNLIEASEITKIVGTFKKETIVDKVSLTLKQGQVIGLLGPNGAGKTTTMKMLLGLTKISSGTAYMLGKNVPEPLSRDGVGFLPEAIQHPDYLSVWEYLKYHSSLHNHKPDVTAIEEQLTKVNMLEFKDRLLKDCSKGMRQRVDIARILLNKAKIIFLDEPFSGLDPCGQVMLKDIISDLKQQNIAVLVNSHAVGNLADICDQVCIMNKGKILVNDSLSNLLTTGKHQVFIVFKNNEACTDFYEKHKAAGAHFQKENRIEFVSADKDLLNKIVAEAIKVEGEIESFKPILLSLDQLFVKVLASDAFELAQA